MKVKLLSSNYPIISGIYKIDFPNGKSYIGQSKNIYKRIKEHNNYAMYGHGHTTISACDQAIKKYGLIKEFEILEEVKNFDLLDEKESYYINLYHTGIKENGYNIVAFGNASNKSGVEHCLASFNEEQINEIYNLLQNNLKITQKEIAKKFGVNEVTISRINLGQSYINNNLTYPLRPSNNKEFVKKSTLFDYNLSEENLLSLKEDLKWDWELNIEKDISQKYNLPIGIIRDINQGRLFCEYGEYEYPIRNKNFIKKTNSLTKEQVKEIIKDLRAGKTKVEISKKFNIGRHLVLNIQRGNSYRLKDENYPI